MEEVQIHEGTNTLHYIGTDLSSVLLTAGKDIGGRVVYDAKLIVQTGMRHTETHEHPWELIVQDRP
jgi:hypothetical protein